MVRSSVAAWSRPLGCRRLCLYLPIHGINTTLLPFVEREFIVFILTGLLLVLGRFNSRYTILSQVRRFLVFLVESFCKTVYRIWKSFLDLILTEYPLLLIRLLLDFTELSWTWKSVPLTRLLLNSIIAGLYWALVNLKIFPIDSIIAEFNTYWTWRSFKIDYCWTQNCWTLLNFTELESLSYWLDYCWIMKLIPGAQCTPLSQPPQRH